GVDHSRGFTDQPQLLVNRDPVTPTQDNVYVAYDDFGRGNDLPTMQVSVSTGTSPLSFPTDRSSGMSSNTINPGLRLAKDPRNGWMYSIFQDCLLGCVGFNTDAKTIQYLLNRTT